MSHKRFIVSGLLVLLSLLFLGFFQESEALSFAFQLFVVMSVFFLVIPLVYCKLVLREPLSRMGWQGGDPKAGLLAGLAAVAFGLVGLFALIQFFPLAEFHELPRIVEADFRWFLLYELVLVGYTALLYEVFFRGLIQTLWLGHLGYTAVAVQAVIFLGVMALSGGFTWQNAPLLLFSPLAGLVAYWSGSLRASWLASWLFLVLSDVFLLMLRS